MQLPHHLLHPSQILRWDGFFQFPDDIHGLAAGMADIGGFAQEGIGRGAQGVLLELADEQQDPSEYSARDCAARPLKLSIHSGGIEHACRRR